jgi:hypothetical protein
MIAAAMATSARTLASAPCAVPPAVGAPLPTRAKTPTIEGEVSSSKREIEKSATNCHGRRGKRCRWPSRGSAATCPSPRTSSGRTSSSVFAPSLPTARGALDSHAARGIGARPYATWQPPWGRRVGTIGSSMKG